MDHTITRHSTGRRLVQFGVRHGLFSLGDVISLPYHYLRYRAGTIDIGRALQAVMRLRGRSQAELEEIALACFKKRVLGDLFEEARTRINSHIDAGDTVAIASSSIGLIVRPLARALAIEHVIVTELEFERGVATGRLANEPCYGDEKRDRVIQLAGRLGILVSDLTFYSDSHLDLPLLQAAGTAIAVNPDRRLRREAVQKGWDIVQFR